jgi:hypothetical protein
MAIHIGGQEIIVKNQSDQGILDRLDEVVDVCRCGVAEVNNCEAQRGETTPADCQDPTSSPPPYVQISSMPGDFSSFLVCARPVV